MKNIDLKNELIRFKQKTQSNEEDLIHEVHQILSQDLFTKKKILQNLKQYNNLFDVINEEDVKNELIFKIADIKKIALDYRLKFIDTRFFKPEIPYEAILKIKDLNTHFHKDLKGFKILAPIEAFKSDTLKEASILFVPTNYGNYCIVHTWGDSLKWYRKLASWPLKNFDNLFKSVLLCTLIITLSLPTFLITLDSDATYWSGYRAAAFMHLLIFNCGVTTYFIFVLGKNLSSIVWNHYKDFG